jgi:hypothetical protein
LAGLFAGRMLACRRATSTEGGDKAGALEVHGEHFYTEHFDTELRLILYERQPGSILRLDGDSEKRCAR